jgi:hypothetical protein
LQKSPSSQSASSGVLSQLSVPSLQASTVHPTPSSQSTGVPGWQSFAGSQVSAPSQNRPLSQKASSGVFTQVSAASSQESRVQPTPSSQLAGAPLMQFPAPSQISPTLQKSPSSQAEPESSKVQLAEQQSPSSVFPSSHSSPDSTVPFPQTAAGSQVSVPSLQVSVAGSQGGVPGWQSFTASQVSAPLQKSPSSQSRSSGALSHWSVFSLQRSVVQSTPSSQSTGVPGWQSFTASQVSTPSQNSPLLQAASSGVLSQESVPSLQASTVHPTPSSQSTGVPGWQSSWASQVSAPSQNRPLSQTASSGVLLHVSEGSSQASAVQPTPSSQGSTPRFSQSPAPSHSSWPLQNWPSSQTDPAGS